MKKHSIPYGHQFFSTIFPPQSTDLSIREPSLQMDESRFCNLLDQFIKHNHLDLSHPIIVVTDKTRLCGYPTYLPLLIQQFKKHGMKEETLRFIIAYGTHPRQSEEECIATYGEIYSDSLFIHHDCQANDLFVELGHTSLGTPIRYRRDILEASAVITMGPICHHYFAGYGGGRKLIFPGCGERRAIYQNHSLYLDIENDSLSTSCQPGVLDKNPIADDLFEIESKKTADLAIHAILDSHGNVADMFFGKTREDYLAACAHHAQSCEVASGVYDTVVASCGGFPKDINFIQSHKAIHNAAMFVEDGGLLIIYSECSDSIGSKTFLPWFETGNFSKAFKKLRCKYEGNGGTALAMMTKLQRITIAMVTELDENTCQLMGVQKWSHELVKQHLQESKGSLAWIENASLLVSKSRD